jgi:aminopeptidase N
VAGGGKLELDSTFVASDGQDPVDESLDAAFREQALLLPSETMIAEQMDVVNPQAIHMARQFVRRMIGTALHASCWPSTRPTRRPAPTARTPNRPACAA